MSVSLHEQAIQNPHFGLLDKTQTGTLAEFENSHLNLGLGNFVLIRVHMRVGSAENQCEVHRFVPHTPQQGNQSKALHPAPGAFHGEEEASLPCLDARDESPETMLPLNAGAPGRCGSKAW